MYCSKTVNTHVFVDVVVPADFQVMTVKENSTWKCARSTNAIPTPTMYSQPCGPLFLTQVIHLQIFTLLPSRDTFVCLSPFMFSIHLLAERVLCKTLKRDFGGWEMDWIAGCCLIVFCFGCFDGTHPGYGFLRVCRGFGSTGAFVTRKLKSVLWLAVCSPGRYQFRLQHACLMSLALSFPSYQCGLLDFRIYW